MSTENVEVFNRYYGNGAATQFSIGFPYLKREFVKVYLYKKDTDEEKVLNSDQFSFVNDSIIQYPVLPTDEILKEGDIITIQRETELGSEFEFDNQRRLFPVEVMNADDLAFQQIQELSREINRAVRVNPTAAETPEELLQTVYDKLDSATEIAGDAISAANQAQTAADNATAAVNSAEQTLANVTAYVDAAKIEIDNTKNTAISTINTAVSTAESNISSIVSDAEGSVTNIAVTEANKAIANAAQEATDTAKANLNSYVDGTVKPSLQTYVDQAQEDANSAATSMEQAALSATSASNFASNASASETNALSSKNAAASSATAASGSANNAKIWAEGTDSEVQGLGGVHSSKVWSEIVEGAITTIEGCIGDIGFAPLGIDETQNKRRYLNGQVISQSQFVSFTNKIKSAIELYPSLATSETNWQAEVTNSKLGQCGKFVIDDTAGTIRLPCVVNAQSLTDLQYLGTIKSESLPNITGFEDMWGTGTGTDNPSGSYKKRANGANADITLGGGQLKTYLHEFDASGSSSTYQNNAPVQQEAVQYPYYIQVATGVEESVDVSTEIQLNNPFSLLDYKWSEYELSNASWLISNGSFHSGATYSAVYELLLKIYNGTETKEGVSVKLSTEAYADTDFVLNTADTTFRLPVKVKLASGNAVVGNGMTLGLTNGTENVGLQNYVGSSQWNLNVSRRAYGSNVGSAYITYSDSSDGSYGITTDPTKSGIETSSQGLKLYFYVGETIQDANVINAAGVLTRVSNSIDRTVASDRETVVGWGMPDYSAGVSKSASFTADYDGYVYVKVTGGYGELTIKIAGKEIAHHANSSSNVSPSYFLPITKGSNFSYTRNSGDYNLASVVFYPCKGAN